MAKAIDLTARDFAEGMAKALRDDFGTDASMAKTIAELTGASLGAVRKWLAGENGPTGEYLLKLMAASESVWAFVLSTTGRDRHGEEMQARMRRALAIMEGREEPPQVIDMVPRLEAEIAAESRRALAPSKAERMPPRPYREWKMVR